MKKNLSIICSFCLGLFVSIAVIACAVDDGFKNPSPSSKTDTTLRICDIITEDNANSWQWEINYYEDERIAEIITDDGEYTFSYQKNSIVVSHSNGATTAVSLNRSVDDFVPHIINDLALDVFSHIMENSLKEPRILNATGQYVNNNGEADTWDVASINYDESGRIINITVDRGEDTYQIDYEGNLVKMKLNNSSSSYTIILSLDDSVDKYSVEDLNRIILDSFGVAAWS